MSGSLLQRRPLPKREQLVSRSVKTQMKKRKSTAEKVQNYWKCDDIDAYRSFQYSDKDLYCCRPRGPNPFPRRNPKRLSKLYKKKRDTKLYISPYGFTYYKLDWRIDDFDCDNNKGRINYSYSNAIELRHDVSEEEDFTLHKHDVNEIDSIPALLEQKKPWRQILLLEQQLCEIDELLNEEKRDVRTESFCIDRHQRKTGKMTSFADPDEMLPKMCSFKVNNTKEISNDNLGRSDNEIILTEYSYAIKEDSRARAYGKTLLDLKASYLDYLPRITPDLIHNITSINLSFNYFSTFPHQLYCLKNMISLNMRNNPLLTIPSKIQELAELEYLNFSFCKLTYVDGGVFSLRYLKTLDLSYNFLTSIHENIEKLDSLENLSVDGNRLKYFPQTILNINLNSLSCNSNFTNRVFWKDSCPSSPQRLMDVAMTTLARNDHLNLVPVTIQENIFDGTRCPYCNGLVAGRGIPALKPVVELVGIKNLPLLFVVCSQTCRLKLQQCSELPLINYSEK